MDTTIEYTQREGIYKCPVCGFDYTHIENIAMHEVDGHINFTFSGFCEEGHRFSEEFYQHKGKTTVKAEYLGKRLP